METHLHLASRRSGRNSQVEASRAASGPGTQQRCSPGAARAPNTGAGGSPPRGARGARRTRPGRTPRRPPPQPSGQSLGREEELAGDFEAVRRSQRAGAARPLLPRLGRGSGAGGLELGLQRAPDLPPSLPPRIRDSGSGGKVLAAAGGHPTSFPRRLAMDLLLLHPLGHLERAGGA